VRSLGLPVLISPLGRLNPFWIMSQLYLGPMFTWLSTLGDPFNVFNFIHYSTNSWSFFSRHTLHLRYGPAFFIIPPVGTQLIIADAGAAEKVQSRRQVFLKNETMFNR
jgi:hypothetical protein